MNDHLKFFGLTRNNSLDDIKKKHRELSKLYHPDLHPDIDTDLIVRLNVSYAWLLKKTRNRALSRFLIHRLSGRFVPNDKKYNYNPQEWMFKWLSDPLLQKNNPLYGMEVNDTSIPLAIWLLIWYDKFPINVYSNPYHIEQTCQYSPIYRYTQTAELTKIGMQNTPGDYLIGIVVDDDEISKINKITIKFKYIECIH